MNEKIIDDGPWDTIIEAPKNHIALNFKELFQYKYLVYLFIKRDFQTAYKQTILGPLWFIIQPLMTTGIYSIIFAGVAGIPTDRIPAPVFYLAGTVVWTFFQNILTSNSSILVGNAGLFGKVYFPRLAVPIATSLSKLFNFGIQFVLFITVYLFFIFRGVSMAPSWWLVAVPLAMLQLGVLGVGFGLWASAWTVKYRDLSHLVSFGMSLWMWATPIVYPMSFVSNDLLRNVIRINPAAQAIELFRAGFTGVGTIDPLWITYSWVFSIIIFFIGLGFFKKAERNYVDVV
jgi:lipopolysaccharide transport system permease protein